MKSSTLLELAFQRTTEVLLDDRTKDDIRELISYFDKFGLETKEMWLELHYGAQTDFIMEITDYVTLSKLCAYMVEITDGESLMAWDQVGMTIERIMENPEKLWRYIHVCSLEFDKVDIEDQSFCPSIFIEIDVEKAIEDGVSIKDILFDYEDLVLSKVYGLKDHFRNDKKLQEIMDLGINPWNLGLMFSRPSLLRMVTVPMDNEKFKLVKDIYSFSNRINRHMNEDDPTVEYMLDYDYDGHNYSNKGANIYHKNSDDRKNIVHKYAEQGNITSKEENEIVQWEKRKVFGTDDRSLIVWQIAHLKYKEDKEEDALKMYLRIMELR